MAETTYQRVDSLMRADRKRERANALAWIFILAPLLAWGFIFGNGVVIIVLMLLLLSQILRWWI